jgi:hypothetical protein
MKRLFIAMWLLAAGSCAHAQALNVVPGPVSESATCDVDAKRQR